MISNISSILVPVIYLYCFVGSLLERFAGTKEYHLSFTHKLTDSGESVFELFLFAMCLSIPRYRSKEWQYYFIVFKQLREKLFPTYCLHKRRGEIIAVYVFLLCFIVFDGLSIDVINEKLYRYYCFVAINKIYYGGLAYLMNITTRILRKSYDILNDKLIFQMRVGNNERELTQIKKIQLTLYNAVCHFNSVFGWQIFYMQVITVIITLNVITDLLAVLNTSVDILWTTVMYDSVFTSVYMVSLRYI